MTVTETATETFEEIIVRGSTQPDAGPFRRAVGVVGSHVEVIEIRRRVFLVVPDDDEVTPVQGDDGFGPLFIGILSVIDLQRAADGGTTVVEHADVCVTTESKAIIEHITGTRHRVPSRRESTTLQGRHQWDALISSPGGVDVRIRAERGAG